MSSKMCAVCMCAHMGLPEGVMRLESGLDFSELVMGTMECF